MRQDKLTTKFQQALGDAQSVALAHDHQVLEPIHLLAALLKDSEDASRSLLERAGVNVGQLERRVEERLRAMPSVSGTDGDIQISRELGNILNLTERRR